MVIRSSARASHGACWAVWYVCPIPTVSSATWPWATGFAFPGCSEDRGKPSTQSSGEEERWCELFGEAPHRSLPSRHEQDREEGAQHRRHETKAGEGQCRNPIGFPGKRQRNCESEDRATEESENPEDAERHDKCLKDRRPVERSKPGNDDRPQRCARPTPDRRHPQNRHVT